jgi:hypothetical protein
VIMVFRRAIQKVPCLTPPCHPGALLAAGVPVDELVETELRAKLVLAMKHGNMLVRAGAGRPT